MAAIHFLDPRICDATYCTTDRKGHPMTDRPQYIVFDLHRNPYGPFYSASEAGKWAKEKWPDLEEDNPQIGERTGWSVSVLRMPD